MATGAEPKWEQNKERDSNRSGIRSRRGSRNDIKSTTWLTGEVEIAAVAEAIWLKVRIIPEFQLTIG